MSTLTCMCCDIALPRGTAILYCDPCNKDQCLDEDGNAYHGENNG